MLSNFDQNVILKGKKGEMSKILFRYFLLFDSEDAEYAGELEIYDETADDDSQAVESGSEETETLSGVCEEGDWSAGDLQEAYAAWFDWEHLGTASRSA